MLLFTLVIFAFGALLAFAFFQANNGKILARPMNTNVSNTTSFFNLKATSLDGKEVDFQQFKGKKVIVLNVASECGYTPQYADWQRFYEANKDEAVVLGFPSNQFGGQEPGAAAEIAQFCQKNYGVTFPMFEKGDVKGENKTAVYRWLTDASQNGWNTQEPGWNFCKYVINEEGQLTHFFASKVKPADEEFLKAMGL